MPPTSRREGPLLAGLHRRYGRRMGGAPWPSRRHLVADVVDCADAVGGGDAGDREARRRRHGRGGRGLLDAGPLSRDDLMQSMPPLANTKH